MNRREMLALLPALPMAVTADEGPPITGIELRDVVHASSTNGDYFCYDVTGEMIEDAVWADFARGELGIVCPSDPPAGRMVSESDDDNFPTIVVRRRFYLEHVDTKRRYYSR